MVPQLSQLQRMEMLCHDLIYSDVLQQLSTHKHQQPHMSCFCLYYYYYYFDLLLGKKKSTVGSVLMLISKPINPAASNPSQVHVTLKLSLCIVMLLLLWLISILCSIINSNLYFFLYSLEYIMCDAITWLYM